MIELAKYIKLLEISGKGGAALIFTARANSLIRINPKPEGYIYNLGVVGIWQCDCCKKITKVEGNETVPCVYKTKLPWMQETGVSLEHILCNNCYKFKVPLQVVPTNKLYDAGPPWEASAGAGMDNGGWK